MDEAVNKGYLLENFRLFHLKDRRAPAVEPHYHEFDKLVALFSGAVDYTVEGACYKMRPGGLLFVRHHAIHRPVIDPGSVYERCVLWIAPAYLQRLSPAGESLETCFDLSLERRSCLYRPSYERFERLRKQLLELETALTENDFGGEALSNACFVRLLVELNRMALRSRGETPQNGDRQIDDTLRYIHDHLSEPLSVDALAARCYLSRYYFMRRFKDATGCTVHGYIQQKRLTAAAERLDGGDGVQEAALGVGFSEYSSFLRAFRKAFGMTPSEYLRRKRGLKGDYTE